MTFAPTTYAARREALRTALEGQPVFLQGRAPSPRNYAANTYPFRQDSTLLYYCGIARPHCALLIGATAAEDRLFVPEHSLDDLVWEGPQPSARALADSAGIAQTGVIDPTAALRLTDELVLAAVIAQRALKSADEIAEIEEALQVTAQMHRLVMALAAPGRTEVELAGAMQGLALAHGRQQAYGPIVTAHGETLHISPTTAVLREGQLLLNDSAAESPLGYASDITRTLPVGGRYTPQQRDIYTLVLETQLASIAAIRPGVPYRDIHLAAARRFSAGLVELGLMQGDPDEAVAAGAHAAFFPHGLGHMLGLDVHDMEDLGEDRVGYDASVQRSTQFGLNFLRLARPLRTGFVLTVEPGLYFIPALWEQWQAENRHRAFIRYDKLAAWRDFGGVRIEDDVLVTESGARVLGPGIPKTIDEVLEAMHAPAEADDATTRSAALFSH